MRFGPAGYPSAGKTPEGSLEYTKSLGLDALEVEFVRGARIKPERAREIGAKAKELDIRLSCHAPYFISFNSDNPETRAKSVEWVTSTARAAHGLGAYIIVIHAASYGKSPETALPSVIEGLSECKGMSEVWRRWPRRMLRHKALIQCARVAFGFAGIYDEDEGERIAIAQAAEAAPKLVRRATAAELAGTSNLAPALPPAPDTTEGDAMPDTGENLVAGQEAVPVGDFLE